MQINGSESSRYWTRHTIEAISAEPRPKSGRQAQRDPEWKATEVGNFEPAWSSPGCRREHPVNLSKIRACKQEEVIYLERLCYDKMLELDSFRSNGLMKRKHSIICCYFLWSNGGNKIDKQISTKNKTLEGVKIKSEFQRKMRNSILNAWPKFSFISRYNQLYALGAELWRWKFKTEVNVSLQQWQVRNRSRSRLMRWRKEPEPESSRKWATSGQM